MVITVQYAYGYGTRYKNGHGICSHIPCPSLPVTAGPAAHPEGVACASHTHLATCLHCTCTCLKKVSEVLEPFPSPPPNIVVNMHCILVPHPILYCMHIHIRTRTTRGFKPHCNEGKKERKKKKTAKTATKEKPHRGLRGDCLAACRITRYIQYCTYFVVLVTRTPILLYAWVSSNPGRPAAYRKLGFGIADCGITVRG